MFRESETVEFKRSTAELREAVVSVAAMLNKHGVATVYFGISDDGRVCGQMIGRQTVRDVTQTVVDNIEPRVFPKVAVREIDGKDCLVVEAAGSHGLYFAYGRAYVRVGESDKALTAHEIETRVLKNKKVLWETERSTSLLADINEDAVREFAGKAMTANRIDFEFVDAKTTLNKLGLLNGDALLHAAEVLFCDNNSMEFQAAIFAGTDKLTFLDIKQFKGNLFGLRRQVEIYIGEHMRWRVDLTGRRREEIPEVPIRAISEAVGNSLCHRDYSNPKGNEVAIFKDRIEIYNPGLFPEEVEPEDFFAGGERSILRNPLIAETMYKSKDIERWGSGIKRIHEECAAVGVAVDFCRLKTGFVVVFHRPAGNESGDSGNKQRWSEKVVRKGGQKLTAKQAVLIELLGHNPRVSRKELAGIMGIHESAVQKRLEVLRKKGVIRRVGSDRGGHWEVKK